MKRVFRTLRPGNFEGFFLGCEFFNLVESAPIEEKRTSAAKAVKR